MRVVTYNVNSIGPRLPRLRTLLAEHRPDVVLLQETKSAPEAFPRRELAEDGYLVGDHSGGRWAGVAILARSHLGVDDVTTGLPGEPDPDQARWVEADVGGIRFVSVYVPNGQQVGSRPFTEKLAFLEVMAARAAELVERGPVVIGGDMNVCRTDLDVWDAEALHGGTHATDEERSRFEDIIDAGYTDVFRSLNPEDPGFSWWDYRAGHFHKGYGLRIDLLLAAGEPAERARAAWIERDYRKPTKVRESKPSDHAPLLVDFDLTPTPGPSATDDALATLPAEPTEPAQLDLLGQD